MAENKIRKGIYFIAAAQDQAGRIIGFEYSHDKTEVERRIKVSGLRPYGRISPQIGNLKKMGLSE